MPYTIIKTDGSVLADVLDNSTDKISTDLTLVGKSTNNYGLEFNQNFVKLLENFASTTEPKAPIKGQIWYDTSEEKIRIFNGKVFKEPNRPQISSSEPVLSPGDIWIDSLRRQLYFNDGQGTRLAGPIYSAQQGVTGNEIINLTDVAGVTKTLIKLKIGDTLLGIFSKDTFTPNYLTSNGRILRNEGISGTIRKGFTPALSEFNFYATAARAQSLVDGVGNIINVSNFIQTTGNNFINGTLSIAGNTPLTLGSSNNVTFEISPNLTTIKNNIQNSNLALNVKNAIGANNAIFIDAIRSRVGIYNSTPLAVLDIDGDVNFRKNIVTNNSTIDIINTTATTINLGGAATAINIGDVTGNTTVNNNLKVVQNVNIDGGSLSSTLTNFNLLNTTVKTINMGAESNTINIGSNASNGIVRFKNNADVLNRLTVSGEIQTGNVLARGNTVRVTSGSLLLNANNSIEFEKNAIAKEDLLLKKLLIFDNVTPKITTTVTSGDTFDFLPENVKNINFGGDATLIYIGSVRGDTYVNNDLNVVGQFFIGYDDSTPASINSKTDTIYVFDTKTKNIYLGGKADNIVIGDPTGQFRVRNNSAYFDGDITIEGRSITGLPSADIRSSDNTRSATIFNQNVTSLAIGGSAFNIEMGNTFGQTIIKNNLEVNGTVTISGRGFNSKATLAVGQFTTEFDFLPSFVASLGIGASASQIRIGRIEDPVTLQLGGTVYIQHNLNVVNKLIMPKLDPLSTSLLGNGLLFKNDNDNEIVASELVRTYGASRALGVTGDIYLTGTIYGPNQIAKIDNAQIKESIILEQGRIKSLTNIANLFIDTGTGTGTGFGVQVDTINLGNLNTLVNIPGNLKLAWKVIRDNYDAKAGDRLFIDTSFRNNNIQVFLPVTPTVGDEIRFIDQTGISVTAQLFIRRNGNLIDGTTNDINITTPGRTFNLVYTGATRGWVYDNA
jgi:hypothetical protein